MGLGQRGSERLFHDAGNTQLQEFDSKFANIFRRHNGDAPVEVLLAHHFVNVWISLHESVLLAEFERTFDPQVANRSQFDVVGMRGLVPSQRDGMPALCMCSTPD